MNGLIGLQSYPGSSKIPKLTLEAATRGYLNNVPSYM